MNQYHIPIIQVADILKLVNAGSDGTWRVEIGFGISRMIVSGYISACPDPVIDIEQGITLCRLKSMDCLKTDECQSLALVILASLRAAEEINRFYANLRVGSDSATDTE